MAVKYEDHLQIKTNKLVPFGVHYNCSSYNEISNWHSNIEVIVVLRGCGKVQYGADTIEVYAGDVIVFNTSVLHRVHKSDDILYHCVIIDEDFCEENGIYTSKLTFDKIFRDTNTEALCINAAESCKSYEASKTSLSAAKARMSVLALLIDLSEKHLKLSENKASNAKNTSEKYVKQVIAYLTKNHTESVTLDSLAEMCGINKCHLAREFKRYTGQTVLTYTTILRCKHAEQCISSGMTVTEAAFESGFESISYFSRTYKRLNGQSPSKIKKQPLA